MKKVMFGMLGLSGLLLLIMSFRSVDQQATPWIVPDKYKTMKSPVTLDKAAAAALYSTHCKSCHGKSGLGDGTKAAQLNTPAGDFSTAAFQKQTDGSLFYKISEGRDDMPSFKKKIPDQNDIWQVALYLRTFAK
ncbi:MAG TPA: cytochrome c [Saprospiraceae bacterium]|nr:cytochrome c [Saprospiraceae bacterium]